MEPEKDILWTNPGGGWEGLGSAATGQGSGNGSDSPTVSSHDNAPFCCLLIASVCFRADTGLEACQRLCGRSPCLLPHPRTSYRVRDALDDSPRQRLQMPPQKKPFSGIRRLTIWQLSFEDPLGTSVPHPVTLVCLYWHCFPFPSTSVTLRSLDSDRSLFPRLLCLPYPPSTQPQ